MVGLPNKATMKLHSWPQPRTRGGHGEVVRGAVLLSLDRSLQYLCLFECHSDCIKKALFCCRGLALWFPLEIGSVKNESVHKKTCVQPHWG